MVTCDKKPAALGTRVITDGAHDKTALVDDVGSEEDLYEDFRSSSHRFGHPGGGGEQLAINEAVSPAPSTPASRTGTPPSAALGDGPPSASLTFGISWLHPSLSAAPEGYLRSALVPPKKFQRFAPPCLSVAIEPCFNRMQRNPLPTPYVTGSYVTCVDHCCLSNTERQLGVELKRRHRRAGFINTNRKESKGGHMTLPAMVTHRGHIQQAVQKAK
ncbi:UNVERIFIED_CONTAM: hypothetical protein FKN15_036785 [Acipenser sinensis]